MKIIQIVLVSLSVVFMVIGIDQSLKSGFLNSYPFYMFMIICFLSFTYLRGKENMKKK
ncbi:MAG: hypothetical protein U0V72_00530 [Cytophagales bacterium]